MTVEWRTEAERKAYFDMQDKTAEIYKVTLTT